MLGNRRTTFRAQSAMEYLMTYGWAILIIAVVLGALFSLGVFSGSSLLGTSCVAAPGYLCSNPTLLTTGLLTFTFGQNTGSTIYNVQIACSATTNSLGMPSNSQAFNVIGSAGVPAGPWNGVVTGATLTSGQTITVTGLPCYGSLNTFLGTGLSIGTTFSGYLLMNYTTGNANSATPSVGASGNLWYTTKIATLTMKVV